MILREAIYKGATRPAMKFGVPLVPLVVLAGGGMLLVVWGGLLLGWWAAVSVIVGAFPVLVWMRLLTARDDQRFRQLSIAVRLRLQHRNQRFWLARSYAPTVYRGASDAWHA